MMLDGSINNLILCTAILSVTVDKFHIKSEKIPSPHDCFSKINYSHTAMEFSTPICTLTVPHIIYLEKRVCSETPHGMKPWTSLLI